MTHFLPLTRLCELVYNNSHFISHVYIDRFVTDLMLASSFSMFNTKINDEIYYL